MLKIWKHTKNIKNIVIIYWKINIKLKNVKLNKTLKISMKNRIKSLKKHIIIAKLTQYIPLILIFLIKRKKVKENI